MTIAPILWSEEGRKWAVIVQEYIDIYSAIRHAPSTRERIEGVLKAFTSWLKGGKPTLGAIEEWMACRIQKEGRSKATANLEMRAIRACTRWAIRRGYWKKDPTIGLEEIPYSLKEQGRFTTLENAKILIAYVTKRPRLGWLVDLLNVLIETGCRIGELLWLRCEDVDLANKFILLKPRKDWAPKDRAPRIVPMTPFVYNIIARRIMSKTTGYVWSTKGGRPLMYRNVIRALTRCGKSAGLEWVNFKSFRSLWATKAAESLTANQLAVVMGHSTPYVTQKHYLHPKHMGVTMPAVISHPGP